MIEPRVLSKLPGVMLTLHSNRLEIEQGMLLTKKRETILLHAITDVSAPALVNRLTITTSDGRKHTFNVRDAQLAREAILAAI